MPQPGVETPIPQAAPQQVAKVQSAANAQPAQSAANALPQTGNDQNATTGAVALGAAAALGAIGMAATGKKKRRN